MNDFLANIEVPPPSRFFRHDAVDAIAMVCNRVYRQGSGDVNGFPLDMERFIDLLKVSLLWDEVEEPEGANFLANYSPKGKGIITVNERHRDLFDERPDVYSYCLGHEVGHCVLRHCEDSTFLVDTPTLFSDQKIETQLFHKSSWNQYGMTKEEVLKRKSLERELVKKAAVSEKARQVLAQLNYRFEPEWMFWQAEHFSLCLHIPKDRLQEQLEEKWDFTKWPAIYQLAERFGISGTMMKTRLVKLQIIKIGEDGLPHPSSQSKQEKLFD